MCNFDNNYDNYSNVSPTSTNRPRQNNFNIRASFNQNDFCRAVDTCNRRNRNSNVAGVSDNYDNNYGNVAGVQEHQHHHHHHHNDRCGCRRRRCCCGFFFW